AVDGRPGHPPADPRILLALWLYATVEGIGSAREVARLCDEHIAFEWLCGGVGMNAKTLADFRVDHGGVLECLLVDSFTALVRAGVASLDRVATISRQARPPTECRESHQRPGLHTWPAPSPRRGHPAPGRQRRNGVSLFPS